MQITAYISNLTSVPISSVYDKRDGLSGDEKKVLLFLADVSSLASLKNVFNVMGRRGISEDCVCSTLNKLVEIGLVEYSSDGYMITDEGEAVALVS